MLGPYILNTNNTSLLTGQVPRDIIHVVIHPLLKKPGSDTSNMAYFRPIFKSLFLSELMDYLNDYYSLEVFQSGFKPFHSTLSKEINRP